MIRYGVVGLRLLQVFDDFSNQDPMHANGKRMLLCGHPSLDTTTAVYSPVAPAAGKVRVHGVAYFSPHDRSPLTCDQHVVPIGRSSTVRNDGSSTTSLPTDGSFHRVPPPLKLNTAVFLSFRQQYIVEHATSCPVLRERGLISPRITKKTSSELCDSHTWRAVTSCHQEQTTAVTKNSAGKHDKKQIYRKLGPKK